MSIALRKAWNYSLMGVVLFFSFNTQASTIQGVSLRSCSANKCYLIESSASDQSHFYAILNFSEISVRVFDKSDPTKEVLRFTGGDSYFDPNQNEVLVRNIRDQKFTEFYINFSSNREIFH